MNNSTTHSPDGRSPPLEEAVKGFVGSALSHLSVLAGRGTYPGIRPYLRHDQHSIKGVICIGVGFRVFLGFPAVWPDTRKFDRGSCGSAGSSGLRKQTESENLSHK